MFVCFSKLGAAPAAWPALALSKAAGRSTDPGREQTCWASGKSGSPRPSAVPLAWEVRGGVRGSLPPARKPSVCGKASCPVFGPKRWARGRPWGCPALAARWLRVCGQSWGGGGATTAGRRSDTEGRNPPPYSLALMGAIHTYCPFKPEPEKREEEEEDWRRRTRSRFHWCLGGKCPPGKLTGNEGQRQGGSPFFFSKSSQGATGRPLASTQVAVSFAS